MFLVSCNASDNKSGLTFNDFQALVKSSAGNNAIDCGFVNINENQLKTNTCITASFVNKLSFYSFYQFQGNDSIGGKAIFSDKNNSLYFWDFDSDPMGQGRPDNGRITKEECLNAAFSGSVNVPSYELFSCQ